MPSAIVPEGWHNWGKTENELTARYGEYNCSGARANESQRVGWRKTLTAAEAADMTNPDIIFNTVSSWTPE